MVSCVFYKLKQLSIFTAMGVLCHMNQRIPQALIGKLKKMNDWTRDLRVLQEETVPRRRITDEDGD